MSLFVQPLAISWLNFTAPAVPSQQVLGAGQRDVWDLRIVPLEQMGGRGGRQHVQGGCEGV